MTVTKLRMTALAPTTQRGFVVGMLASLKECRTNIIGAISLGRSQYPKGAKKRFIAPRTGGSNPFSSCAESANHRFLSVGAQSAGNVPKRRRSGRLLSRPHDTRPNQALGICT